VLAICDGNFVFSPHSLEEEEMRKSSHALFRHKGEGEETPQGKGFGSTRSYRRDRKGEGKKGGRNKLS